MPSGSESSSSMISLQRSMHSSQMYTPGPAMSFFTCFWLFPQNEHFSRSPPSPMRATQFLLYMGPPAPDRMDPAWRACPAMPSTACYLTVPPCGVRWTNQTPSAAREGRGEALPALRRYRHGGGLSPLQGRQHLVDEAVLLGTVRAQELVALDVAADLLFGLARVPGQDGLHGLAHPVDLVGLDLHVARLTVAALGGRLVDQDPRVRQGDPLALGARREQHRGRTGGLADAAGGDLRLDELHGVVDRHHRRHRPAGRVDVHRDLAVRVDGLEREQLGHDIVRGGVVDLDAQEDNALLKELIVRVHLLDPVRRALDEGRQYVPGRWVLGHVRLLPVCGVGSAECAGRGRP